MAKIPQTTPDIVENRHRTFFDCTHLGFCVVRVLFDRSGTPIDYIFEEVNGAFETQSRLSDVIGKRMRDLQPDHQQFWFDMYGRVATSGHPEHGEHQAFDSWYEVNAFRIGEPENRCVGVLFSDVGARKRAEQTLKESEQRFRALATAGSYMSYRMSPNWTRMYQLDGRGLLVTTTKPIENWANTYIPEPDRPMVFEAIGAAIRGRSLFDLEHRVVLADGGIGWTLSRAVPLIDDDGLIVEWCGVATDVTERRLALERLRENEERLRIIVESAHDYAIFTTDISGRIDRWYAGAEEVFGWSAAEVIGAPMEITYTAEDRAAGTPEKERITACEEGRAPNVRWHLRKDRSLVFIDGFVVSLKAENGDIIGFLKIGQDVTNERRAQEHQKTLLAELQHRVRNILAVIRSIVRRTQEDGQSAEDFILHLEGRLDAIARTQVLLTSAVDAKIDLDMLIREELLSHLANDDQIGINGPDIELGSKAAEVLTLAIHELATNSIKYGALSHAKARIRISWRAEDHDQLQWVVISWIETGVPIVTLAPMRQGFGTELITRRVPYELRGTGSLEIKPGGISCHIAFPLLQASSILETGGIPL